MTTYMCPKCHAVLTFRPLEKRKHKYSFPYSDDYWGCDTCGMTYCDYCGSLLAKHCDYCEGKIYRNQIFEPKGMYKLPESLRQLTKEKCEEIIENQYSDGFITLLEREYLMELIQELK